jgi:glutamate-ammonia-ligase adenylyltransferase
VPADAVREIRRLKARIETERVPRGTDPRRNAKLGPGGLADVEWTVQLLQLRHAYDVPALRTPSTIDALEAAGAAGLIGAADAAALGEAWRLASRVRNAVMLARGRPGDALPSNPRDLDRVARLLGYGPGEAGRCVEDYLRVTRHARTVVERVFV